VEFHSDNAKRKRRLAFEEHAQNRGFNCRTSAAGGYYNAQKTREMYIAFEAGAAYQAGLEKEVA
jgi:hypothetical protein